MRRLGLALCVATALTSFGGSADAQFYWPWESPPRPAPQIIIQRPQRYAPPAGTQPSQRHHVRPGARSVCTLTMKFSPVRIDENPSTSTPHSAATTCELENIVENGV